MEGRERGADVIANGRADVKAADSNNVELEIANVINVTKAKDN